MLQYLKYCCEENHRKWKYSWDEEDDKIFVNLLTTSFEELFNIWPFHLIKQNKWGQLRYRKSRLEKEHLQSLVLQYSFHTRFLKRPLDLHLIAQGRWKKTSPTLY